MQEGDYGVFVITLKQAEVDTALQHKYLHFPFHAGE